MSTTFVFRKKTMDFERNGGVWLLFTGEYSKGVIKSGYILSIKPVYGRKLYGCYNDISVFWTINFLRSYEIVNKSKNEISNPTEFVKYL